MHFIVTGGAGFIGSNLVRELQQRHPGAWISVIDDFSSASFSNLSGFAGDVVARPCEELDWERHFGRARVDCIYHLASITDTTVQDQRLMVERNVEGFRRLLDYAQSRGMRVVYASSAATYGLAEGLMHEDQVPAPANVYGFSKAVLDNLARHAARNGMPVLGVRYFNVYGPGEAHKGRMASMVYQLYLQMKAGQRPRIFRSGEQARDFVYVKDAVAGTLAAGDGGAPGAYNIGSGASLSFNSLIAALNSALGTGLEPEYIDNPYIGAYQNNTQAELSRSQAELGYSPQWPADKGIADYVSWLEAGCPTLSCWQEPQAPVREVAVPEAFV
ncbi:ADP-glyceromanno-heptose 6-epimerase [bacterium]|nr:ADP-glyceromanno-heptose 6-epimerase [bacterium]